jgi:hypothetical protein
MQAIGNCTSEFVMSNEDPVFAAECVAESSREFALDLAHHLSWLRARSAGADIAEVASLRAQLNAYVQTRFPAREYV